MAPTVSLIIVNFNGKDCLPACLESVFAQSRPADEVIVVDNGSTDGCAQRAKSESKHPFKLLELQQNRGFPAACNEGIGASSGDLVAILNNDIQLDPHWLESLLAYDHPEWDFWASKIVFAFDPDRIDSAGDGMAVVGSAYKMGHGGSTQLHSQAREVFGPCAAAALYRRQLLLETAGFDRDFFLIYEDADLNFRARLLGYRCLFVPEARVVHHVNTSIGTLSENYVFYGQRNSEYVFWKNMPGLLLALYLPERILFDLLSFAFFACRGRTVAFLRAKWDFLRNLKTVFAKRRRIQKSRRIGVRTLRPALDRNWLRYRRNVLKRK